MEDKKHLPLEEEGAQSKFNLKGWLTSVLRRASFRWGPRSQALKLARVDKGLYQCAMCKEAFRHKDIKLDHIIPIVDIKTGFKFRDNGKPDWNEFIDRLFCDVSGFQVLCNACHDAKTMMEDTLRAQYNKERKEQEKLQKKLQKQKK